jgi:RNA polymerase sigma factor (sigma-70 family)
MLLQLQGIGKQKIAYKDHQNIQFDSLSTYIILAKKAISKFANSFYNGLSVKMLKDEDAISAVANAIMMADWRWDDNYRNDKGTKKTKYSYRNQCALWAIQTYISKDSKHKKKHKKVYSLDFTIDNHEDGPNLSSITSDLSELSPEDLAIEKESKEHLSDLINQLLSLDCLSARQKEYIRLYYFESYTFEKIGKKYGITREAVRQGLNKAISNIKEAINE